jgi:hypothetical protein
MKLYQIYQVQMSKARDKLFFQNFRIEDHARPNKKIPATKLFRFFKLNN